MQVGGSAGEPTTGRPDSYMRAAGIFTHLTLAFVCVSLAVLARDTARLAAPEIASLPASTSPSTTPLAMVVADDVRTSDQSGSALAPVASTARPDAADLDHWAAPARLLDAASATTSAPLPTDGAQPAQISAAEIPKPAPPAPKVAAITPADASPAPLAIAPQPETSTAPATAALATPAVAPLLPADPSTETHANGGTPGLKPAKVLFGAVATPAPLAARAIGSYARGCLAGGQALPVDGETWQAMRLSRNRNWGHPKLIKLIEKLSIDGKQKDGWPGLLVGDLAQPRGGPMLTGHASHQIGLDADLWLTPMPDRRLSNKERETIEATSMLSDDGLSVNRDVWTDGHLNIIKRAASYPDVERIFVHPAIKQVLCYAAKDDRSWLSKVRPYWGHHYHFHVRIHCPPGSADCTPQATVPGDDGCGTELDDWLKRLANIKAEPPPLPLPAPPPVAAAKPKVKPPMTLDQLPQACSVVLAKDNPSLQADIDAAAKAVEAAKAAKLAEAANKAAAKTAPKSADKSADKTTEKSVDKTSVTADGKTPVVSAAAKSASARVDANAAPAKPLALPAAAVAKPVTLEKKSASQ